MAIADFTTIVRPARFPFRRLIGAIANWIAARRVARVKSATLQSLLYGPEHLLRDVGISRDELLAAIEKQRKVWPR